MMKQTLLIELHYLPSLEYFVLLDTFDNVAVEQHEHFVKQSYRNRCYINTTQGVAMLTVPLTGKHGKVVIKDIRIDYSQSWQNRQWRSIESAYRNSPYFEHYAEDVNKILYSGSTFLFDLSQQMLSFCLGKLKWDKKISLTDSYSEKGESSFFDMRSQVLDRKGYSARDLYLPQSYYQVFGNTFEENLSVLDLLFCAGPDAGKVLRMSRGNRLNK